MLHGHKNLKEYVVAPMDLEVYVPPLSASIPELKVGIKTAIETITSDMIRTVCNEFYYRVDVCRTTKGHILSTCKVCNKNLERCSIK